MKVRIPTIDKGDIFGGLSAAIVALPLSLAFGMQSGLGAIAGLYGAIAVGIFAAAFGGTATQISGPTGPMTVVSATIIATIIGVKGSIEAALPAILLCFFLAGVFQVIMGILGAGRYIRYIPYPVISGFMTGIGIIIILLQIYPSLGHVSPRTIPEIFRNISTPLENINWYALALCLQTVAIIYLFPKITKAVPSLLVALVSVSLLPILFPAIQVAVIGDIPTGLPKLNFQLFSAITDIDLVITSSLTLAALGSIDSLLTSVVVDNITRTSHDSRKELTGQGIGNMVSALIGGLPGAGAFMRTFVNLKAGGKTKFSGIFHGIILLLILLGLGRFASQIPMAVLSGVLITVGISIMDLKGLKHIWRVTLADAAVMVIVLLLTVFSDLLKAIAAGMIISSIMFMKHIGDITQQRTVSSRKKNTQAENLALNRKYNIPEDITDKVSIKKINGPLFFGNNLYFRDLAREIPPESQILLIDMRETPYIDQSGLYTLEDIILGLEQQGVHVVLLGLQRQPESRMRAIHLIPNLVAEDDIQEDLTSALEVIRKHLTAKAAVQATATTS